MQSNDPEQPVPTDDAKKPDWWYEQGYDLGMEEIAKDLAAHPAVNGVTANSISQSSPISAISISDFLSRPLPPREHIIGPFVKQGLTMVYAPAGVGKTYFAMSLAFAIATGGRFLNWQCEIKQSVIYLDGELPGFLLQDRLRTLIAQNSITQVEGINFHIVTPDLQDIPMPDLSTDEGQGIALKLIGDRQFIVIDNISTLCRTGDENEANDWIPVQNWLLKLRKMGKSVLLIHHAGKSKDSTQRGTSKRADVLDMVIALKHQADWSAVDGCRFEMTFDKSRHFRSANDTKKLVATYTSHGWEIEGLDESIFEKIRYLVGIGMKNKDICEELDLKASHVSKLVTKIKKENEDNLSF